MSNFLVVPLIISTVVVIIAYLMKKDEAEYSKKPNYVVLFAASLFVSMGIMYFVGGNDEPINMVMREIHGGEAPF